MGKDDTETIELSTERNLNVQITAPASATPYAVRLYITNKNDGSSYEMKYTVTVQPSVVSGILALHQDADGVDFDYIATGRSCDDRQEQAYEKCRIFDTRS